MGRKRWLAGLISNLLCGLHVGNERGWDVAFMADVRGVVLTILNNLNPPNT